MSFDATSKRFIRRTALVVLGMFIVTVSVLPVETVPVPEDLSDKLGHFVAYALWTAFLLLRPGRGRRFWAYVAIIILTGVGIELIQPYFGRNGEVLDAVANTSGVLLALGVGYLLQRVHPNE